MDKANQISDFIMEQTNGISPTVVDKDKDYLPKLKDILDKYCAAIESCDVLADKADDVKSLATNIIHAIELSYEGKNATAYELIKAFANHYASYQQCIRVLSEIGHGTEYKTLYRGRCADDIGELKEMFHRPFSQRPFIPTERYSVPGLPCLYLAGSVYTCWKEIGKPSHDQFYVSRIEADETVKVLDLAQHPRDCEIGEYDPEIYCVIWPLICACSFKVKEKNRVFHSEYIIPQLLMQVVINTDGLDGIRFLSSHQPTKTIGYATPLYVNYAFPAPYEENTSFSSLLLKKFKATSAVCINEVAQLSAANLWTVQHWGTKHNTEYSLPSKFQNGNRRYGAIKACMDRFSEYEHTSYFRIEELLYKFEAINIDV